MSPGLRDRAEQARDDVERASEAPADARCDSVSYRWVGTDGFRIEVLTEAPAVVLIRNAYDENWRASVDEEPATVHVADYLLQAVPVPAGRHTIELRHVDPWLGPSLAVSAISVIALAAAAVASGRRRPQFQN